MRLIMKNKTLKRTYDLAKPHKKTIVIVSILSLFVAIIEIIRPYLVEIVIDQYLTKGIVQQGFLTITRIGFIYLALVVISNAIDFIAIATTNRHKMLIFLFMTRLQLVNYL